eukprot:TRINITY_DN6850_c0_g1_i1.p1 TRINITY_DN6850_c0_g1~~TRINITY_DN6850_c0_g1_i1.p1  ORF type:complete len:254 (-),score=73.95 TRINITY_DN6850_c0_g1_i1:37-729(-)
MASRLLLRAALALVLAASCGAKCNDASRLTFNVVRAIVSVAFAAGSTTLKTDGPKVQQLPQLVSVALKEFGGTASEGELTACVPSGELHAFASRTKAAMQKMVEKRNSAMRLGLGKLGRAIALLADVTATKCGEKVAESASTLKKLALQLEGYGKDKKFIEYKAMEKLKVDGHDIHKPLNAFIGAWVKDDASGSSCGETLGQFFKVLQGEAAKEKKEESAEKKEDKKQEL